MRPQKISTAQIKYIQCERRRAGIDDDTYAAMKTSVGVASTVDLDQRQFNELLRRIGKLRQNARRRQSTPPPAARPPLFSKPPDDKAAMLSKIEAILAELKLSWSYADGIAKQQTRGSIERLRFCDDSQTYKVLQALIYHQKRKSSAGFQPVDCNTVKTNDQAFYVRELKGEGCQCGASKKSGYSFCWSCFSKLPEEMRKALYRKLGKGYEQAYDAAVVHLTGEEANG
ncbi:MAG: regulatory protein GemA [Syntrophobacteraceae bacterium]